MRYLFPSTKASFTQCHTLYSAPLADTSSPNIYPDGKGKGKKRFPSPLLSFQTPFSLAPPCFID